MKKIAYSLSVAAASLIASGLGAGLASASQPSRMTENPFAPSYQHSYRHGAVPTREAWQQMQAWAKAHGLSLPGTTSSNTLSYGGGRNGIGVVSGTPRVYLVFWGSQWLSGGDPDGAAAYLQSLFAGIGTGGELWSGTMTQYCDGSGISKGATSCPATGVSYVGYPSSGALAGVWFITGKAAPNSATIRGLATVATAAAVHFGNTTAASNRYALYIVASPSGTHPDGFGTTGSTFCAWHDYASTKRGYIAYTNLPYVDDLGASCGQSFVNAGPAGVNDGFSIVAGHEYAETLTDMLPSAGWTNATTGAEDGDECAWISSGQGAAANVSMGNGAYAMQSTWSNDTNECDISHAIIN